MKNIVLTNRAVYNGDLILVNGYHPYHETIHKKRLVPVYRHHRDLLLDERAEVMLRALLNQLGAWDQIEAVSGWRSTREQTELYESSARENGIAFTQQYVAVPGHSEHQTGLAVDLARTARSIDRIRPDFPDTGICGQFRKLAATYGFIERYPAGKEAITGIAHEPWHFRYVGIPHAQVMARSGLCLEEYVALLRGQRYGMEPLQFKGRRLFEISYVPVTEPMTLAMEIEESTPCTLSGNNQDGVILTVLKEAEDGDGEGGE